MLTLGRRLFLLFSLLSIALADKNLIPTSASDSFPQCGIDCSVLQQAQDSCTAGPESSWTSCFCESALLTSLKSSGNLCTSCTSTTDQSQLSTWYNNYCSSGGGTNNGNENANSNKGSDTAAPSSSVSSDAATASSATPSATAASANSHNLSATEENRSWWSTHYKWIIMLIVLVVAFTIIAVLGVWFKRRYDAKHAVFYNTGGTASSTSGVLAHNSGVFTPTPVGYGAPPAPNQPQPHGLAPDSVASSSRTDVAAKGPAGSLSSPSRSRLQKYSPSTAADVEIRQISRS